MANIKSEKDVTLRIKAQTNEASRNIAELQRQVDKLGNLADQGKKLQRGFLSEKQVYMYKRIMKEIESDYRTHYSRLEKMEKDYVNNVERAQKEVSRRRDLLNRAQGGNRWGDVSSDMVIDHHTRKLEEAKKKLSDAKSADASHINVMKQYVKEMESERSRAQYHSTRIGNLRQLGPKGRYMADAAGHIISHSGMVLSSAGMVRYAYQGLHNVQYNERMSAILGQKLENYGGRDGFIRTQARNTGLTNQYTASQTLQLQGILARGGLGSEKNLQKDTSSLQRFSRAYGINPNEVASQSAVLSRMETLSDGQMRHFAELIGGQIASNNMKGRESEQTQATVSLAQSVAQTLPYLSFSGLKNIANLQTSLGNTIPGLKGARGASMLSNMDSTLKAGGNAEDILLGYGSKYFGPQGKWKLQLMESQGISNPQLLQSLIQGVFTHVSGDTSSGNALRKEILSQRLGLPAPVVEQLYKKGWFQQVANGQISKQSAENTLQNLGKAKTADQVDQWMKSNSERVQSNQSHNQALKNQVATPWERIGGDISSAWNGIPRWGREAMIYGGGIIGSSLFHGALLKRIFSHKIGGPGGGLAGEESLLGKGKSLIEKMFTKGDASKIVTDARGLAGPTSRIVGKAAPELGALMLANKPADNFSDWLFGHSKGDAIVGGLFYNPSHPKKYTDTREGAITKAIDWVDKLFGGNGIHIQGANSDNKNINVKSLNIKDKSFEQYLSQDKLKSGNEMPKPSNKVADTTPNTTTNKGEATLRVIVQGSVSGMDKQNQDKVTNSITQAFSNSFPNSLLNVFFNGGYNLGVDQRRR